MVEMLVVVLLMLTIVVLTSSVLLTSERTNRDIINIARSQIDARLVLYRISKDIRETNVIETAENREVIFYSNVDDDEYFEKVRYYLQDVDSHFSLFRQVDDGGPHLVIENIVDENIFLYYSGLDTVEDLIEMPVVEEELGDIRFVDIAVNIDQSGAQTPYRTMTLSTMITLRNRIY